MTCYSIEKSDGTVVAVHITAGGAWINASESLGVPKETLVAEGYLLSECEIDKSSEIEGPTAKEILDFMLDYFEQMKRNVVGNAAHGTADEAKKLAIEALAVEALRSDIIDEFELYSEDDE